MECTTIGDDNCMTLRCVRDGLTLQLVVLPCNDPPAIHILLEVDIVSESLEFSVDETVSESQEFPSVRGHGTIIITLNQLDGAIGMQV